MIMGHSDHVALSCSSIKGKEQVFCKPEPLLTRRIRTIVPRTQKDCVQGPNGAAFVHPCSPEPCSQGSRERCKRVRLGSRPREYLNGEPKKAINVL